MAAPVRVRRRAPARLEFPHPSLVEAFEIYFKDALTERWRRISFRLADADVAVASAVEYRRVRAEHQVLSDDGDATLAHLRALGADAIEQSRMTIDEIAVAILKGGNHVAPR